jgi:two-component system, NarL family, invasion response regulator UvrY
VIRVLIADDHAVVRKGLKQILLEQPDIGEIGEAANAREALDLARNQVWNLIILDITMPDKNGLEVLKDLRKDFPKMPILILSMHPEEQYAVRAFKTGASGYISKDSAPDELILAIRRIMKGGRYVSASLAERLAFMLEEDLPPQDRLSHREFQVMILLASGKSLSEIADGMSLSVKTISTYRSRILEKMKLNSNAELAQYALKNNLIPS